MLFTERVLVLISFTIGGESVRALQPRHVLSGKGASITSIRTPSLQTQEPINLQQRDASQTTVNYESMPSCASTECVYPASTAPTLACQPTSTPCPSGGGQNCSTVSLDCYCNLRNPLHCAWPCGWSDWMLAENWYSETCPNVKPLAYDFVANSSRKYVPSCAADCLPRQLINRGCTSQSASCFCSNGSLFGCTARCSKSENATLGYWLSAACALDNETALDMVSDDTLSDSSVKDGGPKPPTRRKPLRWYEILPLTVFSASAALFLAIGIVRVFWARSEWVAKLTPWLAKRTTRSKQVQAKQH